MKAFLERWLEPKTDAPDQVEEIKEEVPESLSQEMAVVEDSEAEAVQVVGDEIAWRVEVMRSQIPDKGPLPFLVARETVEPQAGCCLSCGDPLNQGDAYRCAACGRAANLALEMSLSLRQTSTQTGGRVD